jgi:hypothetical protein
MASERLAERITRKSPALSRRTAERRFKSAFGVSSYVCHALWNMLVDQSLPKSATPIHLLWTLCFMKLYTAESVLASLCGCDEKTLRKWVWTMVEQLAKLELVSWKTVENRTLAYCLLD